MVDLRDLSDLSKVYLWYLYVVFPFLQVPMVGWGCRREYVGCCREDSREDVMRLDKV